MSQTHLGAAKQGGLSHSHRIGHEQRTFCGHKVIYTPVTCSILQLNHVNELTGSSQFASAQSQLLLHKSDEPLKRIGSVVGVCERGSAPGEKQMQAGVWYEADGKWCFPKQSH